MQKKYYVVVLRWFVFVCPSVRLCVYVSLRKSAVTFKPLYGLAQNFQGPLNSLQVIFGRVTRTPGPAGSGPDPEKAGFRQIYLLRGFWGRGVVSHLFGIGTTRQTKCWERNFEFWPTAGRRDWPGCRPKFWNFNISYKRDPPLNRAPISFCFIQLFDLTHPEDPTGIFYKITKSNSRNILFCSTFWFDAAPSLYRPVKILTKGARFLVR